MDISIVAVHLTETLEGLRRDAEAQGCKIVDRLVQDWTAGVNRFDQAGEFLCCAIADGEIRGVCGLNRDPFSLLGRAGRVRRLYVSSGHRRRGIASALLDHLILQAAKNFVELHLRTFDPVASAFYVSQGFEAVDGDVNCTHRLRLTVARACPYFRGKLISMCKLVLPVAVP
jgi:GNAT superfamily N-acetyltransferase